MARYWIAFASLVALITGAVWQWRRAADPLIPDFHYRLHRESTPTIFRPYRQELAQGYLVVRSRGSTSAGRLAAVKSAIANATGGKA